MHALSLLTLLFSHFTFYSLILFYFFIFSIFFVFYFSVFLCFLLFHLVVVYYAQLRPFYTACHDKIYRFTHQLLLACCGCPSQTTHWFADCPTTNTIMCWLHHIPFPDKQSFVLFSFFVWHSHPNKGWVFSLTNSYNTHLVIPAHLYLF